MTDETRLIEAAVGGSIPAFTELVANYRDGLFRFLLTRSASYADAEDALQDTMISAYRYLGSYDSQWRFSTWLYRIGIRNVPRPREADAIGVDDLRDEESDPLLLCIAASQRENLWLTARRLLSPNVFTATWLRYVTDMSVNDIADVLEKSPAWTKVNLMRARRTLESEMNKVSEADSNAKAPQSERQNHG